MLGITAVRDGRLNLNKTVTPAIAGPLIIGDDVGAANSAEVRLTVANQIANGSPVEVASDGLLEMNSLRRHRRHAASQRRQRPRRPRLGSDDRHNHPQRRQHLHRRHRRVAPDRQRHLRDVDGDADRGHRRKRHAATERRDARTQRLRWSASHRPARRRQHRGHAPTKVLDEDGARRRAADRRRAPTPARPSSATARCSSTAR